MIFKMESLFNTLRGGILMEIKGHILMDDATSLK